MFENKRRERLPISPRTGLDLVTLSEDEEPVSVMRKEQKMTGSRKSLAVAPKRAPLQQSMRAPPNVSFAGDVVGVGGGKENLPPGKVASYQMKAKRRSIVPDVLARGNSHRMSVYTAIPEDRALGPWEESKPNQQRPKIEKRLRSESLLNVDSRSPKVRKPALTVSVDPDQPVFLTKTASRPSTLPKDQPASRSRDFDVPLIVKKAKERVSHFPVLTEDLANPELYEEQWLDYQEVALTQLLNCVFEPTPKVMDGADNDASLRKNMLAIYSDSSFPLLHKRLQASLLYGALSIPKEHVCRSLKLKEDLGIRQQFAKLWIDTYDLTALQAALEVISGRGTPASSNLPRESSSPGSGKAQQKAKRKIIARFIDGLFIQHEDAQHLPSATGTIAAITRDHPDDFGSYHWCWRRTALRSLMLILLLDKAKAQGVVEGCLFQSLSPYKSSVSVLQAFGNLLLPSLGDIIRPLSHINYAVEVTQHPLQEYKYHISNLAVGLRDGLILARLVEILLFQKPLNYGNKDDGELPLTQYLKYPCPSRALKVHNIHISLSALRKTTSAATWLTSTITAEDIVDGHREKTLTLLWSLISQFGFPLLINWNELRRDIIHRSIGHISSERQKVLTGKDSGKLLLMWAQTIAATKEIDVTNYTTSFADGRALEAIVDAYLPFFPPCANENASAKPQSLSSKLTHLGCSKSFSSLFQTSTARIPSGNETLTTLTFLASRLLPLSRAHRSATAIQRQFRRHLARRQAHRRIIAMQLAHSCALVVQTRNRVIGATVVLQRAWRSVLDGRLEVFLRDVVNIQGVARGWLVRKRLGGRKVERKMRGWW